VADFGERAINMMWKDTGINACIACQSFRPALPSPAGAAGEPTTANSGFAMKMLVLNRMRLREIFCA
jgi:hypothetical protein